MQEELNRRNFSGTAGVRAGAVAERNLCRPGRHGPLSTPGRRLRHCRVLLTLIAVVIPMLALAAESAGQPAEVKKIDASDPTRIVTFVGGGPKFTEYVDGSNVVEAHVSLTMGIGQKDMITVESGYGRHNTTGKKGMTTTEFRHFHLFKMDQVEKGYRGWGSSIQVNFAGSVPGTDGQNIVGLGASPAFALGGKVDIYPIMMVMNSWDKHFGHYNGGGLNFSPLMTVKLNTWDGAFVNIWPQYTRYFWGDLGKRDVGGGQLRLVLGGNFNPTLVWRAIAFFPFDKNLRGYDHNGGFDPRGRDAFLIRVEKYF